MNAGIDRERIDVGEKRIEKVGAKSLGLLFVEE
jgi:hypothetical protein